MIQPHIPVLLTQVLQLFSESHLRIFVDGTVGAGGHAAAILEAHPEIQLFIGIDQDPMAIEIAREGLAPWKSKVALIHSNFEEIPSLLKDLHVEAVSGILLDLGVSSMQLDQSEKGFSIMRPGPLDMRMNPKNRLTAADIVNNWSEGELGRIFREYGEERQWRVAARGIVAARAKKQFQTTQELVDALQPLLSFSKKGIHPLTLIFQALRIAVNRELDVLSRVLPRVIDLLEPKGRIGVISFHSLEDRIVKDYFRFAASDKYDTQGIAGVFLDKMPTVKQVTRKPLSADEKEIKQNPRSRSAKLRCVEKI